MPTVPGAPNTPAPAPPTPPAGDPPAPPASTPPAPPAGDPPQPPAPAPAGDGDEWTPPTREEWDRMQQAIASANRKARQTETAAQRAERERQQQAGEWEQIAQTEQERATKLLANVTTSAVNNTIAEVARSLNFRNPLIAARLIDRDGLEAAVDENTLDVDVPAATRTLIEQRLRKAAEDDPYLATDPPARQAPGAGNPPAGGNPADGHAAMNQMIRRSAGRG